MNTNENSACDRAGLVGDYAFDELAPAERKSMAQHLTTCASCAGELDSLRLTTAALRVLPDIEVPRRIAFVSDKVAETGWFAGFWNSAARLGFAAACVLAVGLSFSAYHRPADVHTTGQTSYLSKADVDAAVNKAVALAVDRVQAENTRLTKAAFDEVENRYAQKNLAMMVSMLENSERNKKRMQYVRLESMGTEQ